MSTWASGSGRCLPPTGCGPVGPCRRTRTCSSTSAARPRCGVTGRRSRRSAPGRDRRACRFPCLRASRSSSSSWPATTRSATASPARAWRCGSSCGAATSRPRRRDAWRTFHDLAFLLALEDVAEPEWAGELLAQLHAFTIDGDRARLDRAARARLGRDPPHVGDRPRPPRHRLAVAARGDLPQADPHDHRAAAAARRLPGARLRALAGAALRVAARARARPCTRG